MKYVVGLFIWILIASRWPMAAQQLETAQGSKQESADIRIDHDGARRGSTPGLHLIGRAPRHGASRGIRRNDRLFEGLAERAPANRAWSHRPASHGRTCGRQPRLPVGIERRQRQRDAAWWRASAGYQDCPVSDGRNGCVHNGGRPTRVGEAPESARARSCTWTQEVAFTQAMSQRALKSTPYRGSRCPFTSTCRIFPFKRPLTRLLDSPRTAFGFIAGPTATEPRRLSSICCETGVPGNLYQ